MKSKVGSGGGIGGAIADFYRGTLAPQVAARLPSMLRFLVSHRRDVLGGLVAAGAVTLILVNGLFMQSGPHPAPIFAIKPLPVVANEPTGAVLPRPRPVAAENVRFELVPLQYANVGATSLFTIRSSVVLPDPLRPSSAVVVPASNCSEISRNKTRPLASV